MPKRQSSPRPETGRNIVRVAKTEKYFKVANAVFSNEHLSWEARGVMGYILSKPDNWQLRLHDLVRRGPAGEHKIRRILHELEAARHLWRGRLRRQDGTFRWLIMIFEDPAVLKKVLDGHPDT